ncbi:MAG: PepSY domain-containing protein [Nitrososphaerales archaeon]|nr:PepSY domain-containing protein [Nitrososphaerales archaeon]
MSTHRKIIPIMTATVIIICSILMLNMIMSVSAKSEGTAINGDKYLKEPQFITIQRERFDKFEGRLVEPSIMRSHMDVKKNSILLMYRGDSRDRVQGQSRNLTITPEQAKAIVEAAIPNFRVGTPISLRTCWIVPIEDGKGVVTSITVGKVSASTSEQAKKIVEESLGKGWKAGEPKLLKTIYNVPLIDSNNTIIGYVKVDGKTGEIVRRPSLTPNITGEQAKAIVNDAIKEFKVGEVKDRGNLWIVNIDYKNKVVMRIPLGKLNTPTAEDALKAVRESLSKGWKAGEPKQLRLVYNVPIIDANGNIIGSVKVDGKTGEIITDFPTPPSLRR